MNLRQLKKKIMLCRCSKSVRLTVPFNDVDMMGVVWFGNYYRYFEAARSALCRELKLDFEDMSEAGYELPVVRSECNYRKPARYNEEIETEIFLVPPDRAMIGFLYVVRKGDEVLAFGTTEHLVCRNGEPLLVWDEQVKRRLPPELFPASRPKERG